MFFSQQSTFKVGQQCYILSSATHGSYNQRNQMWEVVHHCDLRSELLAALPLSLTCKTTARGAAVHVGLTFHYITVWRDTGLCIFNQWKKKRKLQEGRLMEEERRQTSFFCLFCFVFGNSNFLELAQLCHGRETLLSHVSLGPWFVYPLLANWDYRCDQVWRGAVGENVYHFLGIRLKWQV